MVLNATDVTNKFTLHSIGNGVNGDKQVFLSYKRSSGLPSRFHVRSTSELNLPTGTLVNLGEYERSIRSDNTDQPHANNFVYKSTSPGFYPVGNWLNGTQIKGRLIWTYSGSYEKDSGRFLGSEDFKWEKVFDPTEISETPVSETVTLAFGPRGVLRVAELPTTPTAGEEDKLYIVTTSGKSYYWQKVEEGDVSEYKFVETPDGWDGKIGTNGSVKIQFMDIYGSTPKAKVVAGNTVAYSLEKLPDTRTGEQVVDILEYSPSLTPDDPEKYLEVRIEDKSEVDNSGAEPKDVIRRTYYVIPKMRVTTKKFALNLGSDYISSNGLYVYCGTGTSPLNQSQYIIAAKDFAGNKVGRLGYCYLSIPTDINDQADKDYYESIKEEGQTIDDVPHRSIDEYEWSYPAYFEL